MAENKDSKVVAKLSRRQFLMVAGQGAVGLALLASCVPVAQPPAQAPAAAPAAEAVTLDFLAWGDPADIEAWDKLSAMYMEQNPNVTVRVTSVADPNNNYYPKLQTAIAGGTPPHVASFQDWEWQI